MKYPPQITVQLIHIHGGLKGEIQEFNAPVITIGRLPELTLRFPAEEPGVSREHARIEREGNQFRLLALKDKFGTFLNGKQVREALLKNGDVIEFGSGGPKVSFNMEFGPPLAEPEAPPPQQYSVAAELRPPQPRPEPPLPRSPLATGDVGGRQPVDFPVGEAPVQKSSAPLTIQYGPTIRTYRELPVLIGAHPRCDFVLQNRGIMDQHVQIYYHLGDYYVKDLTGQGTVRLNGRPITAAARLNQYDEFECTVSGPVFRFLGDGRLAEVEPPQPDDRFAPPTGELKEGEQPRASAPSGLLSRLVKGFRE